MKKVKPNRSCGLYSCPDTTAITLDCATVFAESQKDPEVNTFSIESWEQGNENWM